jgi:hypothetical protein
VLEGSLSSVVAAVSKASFCLINESSSLLEEETSVAISLEALLN